MTKQDLKWGMKIGLGAGIVMAFVAWLAGGGSLSGTTNYGAPVRPGIFAFLLDGPIAGLVLGGLRPLTRSPLGSAVLGVLIGAPFYALSAIIGGGGPGSFVGWLVWVIIPSLGIGGGGGVMGWFIISRSVKARERRSQGNHHHKGHEQKGHQRRH